MHSWEASENPCIRCGACCAFYRVSFYWREASPADSNFPVPEELTEPLTPFYSCMKGTNRNSSDCRCEALNGTIGESVACRIYENRPTPCQNFEPSYLNGKRNKRCDEARLRHGLAPLTPRDWEPLKPVHPETAKSS